MKAKAKKSIRLLATLALTLAFVTGAYGQSGRPKVLVLPPASNLDKRIVEQFQWELAKELDRSGKFDLVTRDNYEAFMRSMRFDRLPQLPDTLIPLLMDSLQAAIYTSGTLEQPGGQGSQVQAKVDYVYLSRQAESRNYTIEGKPVVADNEKRMGDLAARSAEVIIIASERISAMGIAYSYFRSSIYDKAIEHYNRLLAIEPDDVNTHYMIATSYMRMDSTGKAIDLYKSILQNLDPNHVPSLEILAKTYYAEGDFEQSLSYFERLVQIETDNYEYVQYAAYTLSRLNRQVESLGMFDKLVDIRDDSPEIRMTMGTAAYRLGLNPPAGTDTASVIGFWESDIANFERAVQLYQEMDALDDSQKKNMSDCLYYQAFSLNKIGQQAKALETYKTLLELNPEYPGVYGIMASIANELKRYDEALNYYREALKTATDDQAWRIHLSVGEMYRLRKSDSRNAIESYTSALKNAPANFQQALFYLRGISYYDIAQDFDFSKREDVDIESLIDKREMTKDRADQALAYYDRSAGDLTRVNDPRYAKSAQQHMENIKQLKMRAEQIKKQVDYFERTR